MKILTASAMKIAEGAAVAQGGSYLELMEQAGVGAAEGILTLVDPAERETLILCGKGNNGGDGLVVARHLAKAGGKVTVLLLMGRELSPLSRSNLFLLEGLPVKVLDAEALSEAERLELFRKAGVFVDAVFGTGFSGELPEKIREAMALANRSAGLKIAMDLSSGLNCDTGAFDPDTFRADVTYTFGAKKPAHVLKSSRALCGRVEVVDIGISPVHLDASPEGITMLSRELAAQCLPKRREDSNKGDYGKLLNLGGCRDMTGAVLLSSEAALRCGVGLLRVASVKEVVGLVGGRLPECIHTVLPETEDGVLSVDAAEKLKGYLDWATAALFGCGLSVTEDTKLLAEAVIEGCERPLVIDADGLNCVAADPEVLKKRTGPTVLTPHIKEMSRLTGLPVDVVKARHFDVAGQFAAKYGVTVVLKVLAKVEVLVPSYGYCEVPPCEEFADSVCDEFFSLPLFPQAVCDEDALRARNVSCTCGNYASSTGLGCATTAAGMGCAGTCGCKC